MSDRRMAEGEAMFWQFEEEIESIVAAVPDRRSFKASGFFELIPPLGIIPVYAAGIPKGFDYSKFFEGMSHREPAFIGGTMVSSLVYHGLMFLPLIPTSGELVWLYRIQENMQSYANPTLPSTQPCLMFARGNISYAGNARYDLSRWNFSNYALLTV